MKWLRVEQCTKKWSFIHVYVSQYDTFQWEWNVISSQSESRLHTMLRTYTCKNFLKNVQKSPSKKKFSWVLKEMDNLVSVLLTKPREPWKCLVLGGLRTLSQSHPCPQNNFLSVQTDIWSAVAMTAVTFLYFHIVSFLVMNKHKSHRQTSSVMFTGHGYLWTFFSQYHKTIVIPLYDLILILLLDLIMCLNLSLSHFSFILVISKLWPL